MTKTTTKSKTAVITTIGYEGRSPEELVSLLAENAIDALIDVRQRASSRKRGFGKSALAQSLAGAGIAYHHLPLLGTPADLRQSLRDGEVELTAYLQQYRRYAEKQDAALAELEQLITSRRCVLFCLEADHRECHRAVLAQLLVDRAAGVLELRHL